VIQVLCRRRKNNPLLVGEAGGRQDGDRRGTCLAHRQGRRAEILDKSSVYSLDMGALLAGTKVPR